MKLEAQKSRREEGKKVGEAGVIRMPGRPTK
jgi:hypothetical protein